MAPISQRWQLREADPERVRRLARACSLPEVVARVLVCRGHSDEQAVALHLEASLKTLHDPALLPGMAAARQRLARAIRGGETILVHGDYDVDGVTGTALLMRLFRLLGARACAHIPHRLDDGYSFGPHSVARARAEGASVVVSVDNGTSAHATIAELAALGVDTVVTDHHEPLPGDLPPAAAIVNPKLRGSEYPFRELCGSGVAFKLAWGLCQELSGTGASAVREDLRAFLMDSMAYVALATVCDVVPLVGENRVLARRGLQALSATSHAGLRALLASGGIAPGTLAAEDVAFKLGPRLNAAGRLGSADRALELLLCEDPARARALALELDELNARRKRIEADVLEQALDAARGFEDARAHPVLVLARAGWHQGVVGIVAARLAQRFARPALVIGLPESDGADARGGVGRGSARSVPGFHVLEALRGGERHLLRYGGHAMAAGCEVRAADVAALRAAMCQRAREMLGESVLPEPRLWIDGEVPFAQVTDELMRYLDRLEPFGQDNEKPVLFSPDLRLAEPARAVGDGSHLMLRLRQGERVLKAMAFGMSARGAELAMGTPLHAVYTPRWNSFRGETALELVLHDFRAGARPPLPSAPLPSPSPLPAPLAPIGA